MRRLGHGLAAIASALLLAVTLAHCSSFGSGDGSAGTADASASVTPILCGTADHHCNVGEKCCMSGVGETVCGTDCSSVKFPSGNASPVAWACGRTSDCAAGQECCFRRAGGGSCSNPYFAGSECVAPGNCPVCPAGGNEKGCDPARSDECGAGTTCQRKSTGIIWSYCTP